MIYHYEGKILEFIRECIPEITLATYANEEDMLLSMSDIKKYPSFIYSRRDTDWEYNKSLEVRNGTEVVPFCPFQQTYLGKILVETQLDAIKLARNLRFYWFRKSTVSVDWLPGYEPIDVQLRLLYIKIGEQRNPADKKGACRFVEFSWSSQLFMTESAENITNVSLVEKVNIFLDDNGRGVVIGTDQDGNEIILNNLIQEING